MELRDFLSRLYPLTGKSLENLIAIADELDVRRNTTIIKSGVIERYIYFVKNGIVRAFFNADGREVTFWIGEEGSVALSMESYINNRCGYETIVTLEDCTLYRIDSKALNHLYETDIHIANWGRKLAEREILRAERCLMPLLFTTGAKRYAQLLKSNPGLLNRIHLEHLASYLGVTPVSLSRIRSTLRNSQ